MVKKRSKTQKKNQKKIVAASKKKEAKQKKIAALSTEKSNSSSNSSSSNMKGIKRLCRKMKKQSFFGGVSVTKMGKGGKGVRDKIEKNAWTTVKRNDSKSKNNLKKDAQEDDDMMTIAIKNTSAPKSEKKRQKKFQNKQEKESHLKEVASVRERSMKKGQPTSAEPLPLFPSLVPASLSLAQASTNQDLDRITKSSLNSSLVVDSVKIYPMSILPNSNKSNSWEMKKDTNQNEGHNRFSSLMEDDDYDEEHKNNNSLRGGDIFQFAPPSFSIPSSFSFTPTKSVPIDTDIDPDL